MDLIKVAERGDLPKVQQILARGNVNVNAVNAYGETALHRAAENGHAEVVKALIDAGANVNATEGRYNETPLFFGISNKRIVNLLLDAGANVNARNQYGQGVLHELVTYPGGGDILALLVHAGADVNMTDNQERTPLYDAVSNRNLRWVELLLAQGADNSIPDIAGLTPLMVAITYQEYPIVEHLVESGMGLNIPSFTGRTALDYAIETGNQRIINLLRWELAPSELEDEDVSMTSDASSVDFLPEDDLPLPELVPSQVTASGTVPKTDVLYDVFMASETSVSDFVTEHGTNAVVFHFGKQVIGTLRDALVNGYKDKSAIHYECAAPKGLMVTVNDVINVPYYSLVTTFQSLIPLSEFLGVLTSSHVHWKLERTKDIAYSASRAAIGDGERNIDGQPLNLVSADHCQVGTNKTVFSVVPVTMAVGGRRKNKRTVRQWKKTSLKRGKSTSRRTLRRR